MSAMQPLASHGNLVTRFDEADMRRLQRALRFHATSCSRTGSRGSDTVPQGSRRRSGARAQNHKVAIRIAADHCTSSRPIRILMLQKIDTRTLQPRGRGCEAIGRQVEDKQVLGRRRRSWEAALVSREFDAPVTPGTSHESTVVTVMPRELAKKCKS